ncbi:TSUP family transporter, partial [Arthrobacter rhombi]
MIGAALVFGLIVGGLLGLVGGGGSILAVPALVYGVGMPLSAAIPSSLVVVGASSTMAVLPRIRRDVDWRLALIIGATGGATAFAGTAVNQLLDQQVLLIVFAAIMVLAGIR